MNFVNMSTLFINYIVAILSLLVTDVTSCCYPDQWEAELHDHGGFMADAVSEVYKTNSRFAFDHVKRRWAYWSVTSYSSGDEADSAFYFDHRKGRVYIYHRKDCFSLQLPEHLSFNRICMPGDKYQHNTLRLGHKFEKLHLTPFTFNISGHGFYVTRPVDECLPVTEIYFPSYMEEVSNIDFGPIFLEKTSMFDELSEMRMCEERKKPPKLFRAPKQLEHFQLRIFGEIFLSLAPAK